jgi:hypothetical protein
MSVIALYDCSILRDRNKVGELKKDASGYREITLGAFDCLNSREEYYIFNQQIQHMFEPGGSLYRRLSKGNLRGELEHPRPMPGEDLGVFLNRIGAIYLDKVSHHINKVRLEAAKDENGKTLVLAIGGVIPAGPYSNVTEQALSNREENACFSIRAFSRRWMENQRVNREITNIVTWDLVNEPGIAYANKFDTPTLESAYSLSFTEAELATAERYADHLQELTTMEHSVEVDFTMIRTALGWEKIQVLNPKSAINW